MQSPPLRLSSLAVLILSLGATATCGGTSASQTTTGGPFDIPAGGCDSEVQYAAKHTEHTVLAFEDLRAEYRDLVTSIVSADYVKTHFRFFDLQSEPSDTVLYFYLLYGCYLLEWGELQSGPAIYEGKARYKGPSREWQPRVSEQTARKYVEDAGCDSGNLALGFAPDPNAVLPSGAAALSKLQAVVWSAGHQVDPNAANCFLPTCTVNIDTGALDVQPRVCVGY